jgi:hypothetical protein
MKKSMALILAILFVGLAAAQAFTQPSLEQLRNAANDPTRMSSLLQGASTEEASQVILAVIGEVDKMSISLEQKKQRVNAILEASQTALGDQAEAVMDIVLPEIPPELRPSSGGMVGPGFDTSALLPLAPPVAQKYLGQ